MNLIAGRAPSAGANGTFGIEGATLPLACPAAPQATTLGLRPEHIALTDAAPWRGEVSVVEPTGADTFLVIKTAAGDVTVRVSPQLRVSPGERVGLQVSAAHANWFDTQSGQRLG